MQRKVNLRRSKPGGFPRRTTRRGVDVFALSGRQRRILSTEPEPSRVIVSFLLNRIRPQRCGGFRPPVNRAAAVTSAGVTELLAGLQAHVRGVPLIIYMIFDIIPVLMEVYVRHEHRCKHPTWRKENRENTPHSC